MKRIVQPLLSWLLGFFFVFPTYAEDILPIGCRPFPINGAIATLSTKTTDLFMIHNLSNADLWLTRPISDPSASAGFSSRLQADLWSALLLREPSFEISCIESKPGHEQQVACSEVLALCQWPNMKAPKSLPGTFWAGENKPLSALTAYLGRRGFVLSEHKHARSSN